MSHLAPIPSCDAASEPDPVQDLLAFGAQTSRMIGVARTLLQCGRPVELDGLQGRVGLLCAKALDLPPRQTGLVKVELRRLLDEVADLEAALREQAA